MSYVTTPEPLYQRYWSFHPARSEGRLVLPMWSGTCLPSIPPRGMQYVWGRTDNFIDLPALLYERNDHAGGFAFWAHRGDTERLLSWSVSDARGKRAVQTVQTSWNRAVDDEEGLELRFNSL